MKFINNIISYFKNIFRIKSDIKEIESPKETKKDEVKLNKKFSEKIQVHNSENIVEKNKINQVDVHICTGDGLGLNKILVS